jgi:hypothetical protein
MAELEQRFEQRQQELIREWQSPEVKRRFTKPSTEYLNMRYKSQQMIKTKRFDEMNDIAQLMANQMAAECFEAERKLHTGYARAEAHLHKWLEDEQQILRATLDGRLDGITRARARSVLPYAQRRSAMKVRTEKLEQKLVQPRMVEEPPPPRPFPICNNSALVNINETPRLTLPLPALKCRPFNHSAFKERVLLARSAASSRKTASEAASTVSGMEVYPGSLSLLPSVSPSGRESRSAVPPEPLLTPMESDSGLSPGSAALE